MRGYRNLDASLRYLLGEPPAETPEAIPDPRCTSPRNVHLDADDLAELVDELLADHLFREDCTCRR